jgi:hypothetical protein
MQKKDESRTHAGFSIIVSIVCLLLMMLHLPGAQKQKIDNGSGAYVTKKYRNLFVEAGRSEAEVKAKINAVYQHYFQGNSETQALYYPAGSNANGMVCKSDPRPEGPAEDRPGRQAGMYEQNKNEAPKVRHKEILKCRTFGAHNKQQSNPDLTVGPIACRPFGPQSRASLTNRGGIRISSTYCA